MSFHWKAISAINGNGDYPFWTRHYRQAIINSLIDDVGISEDSLIRDGLKFDSLTDYLEFRAIHSCLWAVNYLSLLKSKGINLEKQSIQLP